MVEDTSDELNFAQKILVFFICAAIFIAFYQSAMIFLAPSVARYKAKNPDNILQGSICYAGITPKGLHRVQINHKRMALSGTTVKGFPAHSKDIVNIFLKEKNKCYQAKYIIVNITLLDNILDFDFFKYYYIYDFYE